MYVLLTPSNLINNFLDIKNTIYWIFSTLFKATPLHSLYRGYQKGTNVFGYIRILTDFVTEAFVIFFQGVQDFLYTTRSMAIQFKDDVKNLFWRLLGYEYDSNARSHGDLLFEDEFEYEREEGHQLQRRTRSSVKRRSDGTVEERHSIHRQSESSFIQRALDTALWPLALLFLLLALYFLTRDRTLPPPPTTHGSTIYQPGDHQHTTLSDTIHNIGHDAYEYVSSVKDEAYEYVSSVKNGAVDYASSVKDNAYDYVSAVKDDTYEYVSSVKDVPEIVSNATTGVATKAWKIFASPVLYGYHVVTYPIFYGWNATKTIFSHAGPFAHFVRDDVKNLGHSVSEGGDTVYHWFTSFLYWIVSQSQFFKR